MSDEKSKQIIITLIEEILGYDNVTYDDFWYAPKGTIINISSTKDQIYVGFRYKSQYLSSIKRYYDTKKNEYKYDRFINGEQSYYRHEFSENDLKKIDKFFNTILKLIKQKIIKPSMVF